MYIQLLICCSSSPDSKFGDVYFTTGNTFFFIEVEGCLLLNTGVHTSSSYDRAGNIQL